MDFFAALADYRPRNEQETADLTLMLDYIARFPNNVLTRKNRVAHLTSSGFVLNPQLTKVLLVHHNQRGVWGWTGGHADGETDLPAVALREAGEETGASCFTMLRREIASVDVLPVAAHWKNSGGSATFISAHLHLSVAYLLLAPEGQPLRPKLDENTAVGWFPLDWFTEEHLSPADAYLYNKLIQRARRWAGLAAGEGKESGGD